MSLRVFVGVIGAALLIGAFVAWDNYTPKIGNGYTVVECGTLHHKGSEQAHDADMRASLGGYGYGSYSAPNELQDKCLEKTEALAAPIYGAGAVGLLTVLGACVVRSRKPTTA